MIDKLWKFLGRNWFMIPMLSLALVSGVLLLLILLEFSYG